MAASQSGVVNIVIQATDNASQQIKRTVSEVVTLEAASEAAASAVALIGAAFKVITNVGPVLAGFNAIYSSLQNVVNLISAIQNNQAFQGWIKGLGDEANNFILGVDRNLFGVFDHIDSGSKKASQEIVSTAKVATSALAAVSAQAGQSADLGLGAKAATAFANLKAEAIASFDEIIAKSNQFKAGFIASDFAQGAIARFEGIKGSARSAFDQIIERATQLKAQFDAINFGDKASQGFDRLSSAANLTFQQIIEKATQFKAQFDASELGQKASAGFAKLAEVATSTFTQITEKAAQLKEQFSSSELGQKASAGFSKLTEVATSTFDRIRDGIEKLGQSIGLQGLSEKFRDVFAKAIQFAFAAFQQIKDKFSSSSQLLVEPPAPASATLGTAQSPTKSGVSAAPSNIVSAPVEAAAAFEQISKQSEGMAEKVQQSFSRAFDFRGSGVNIRTSLNVLDNALSSQIQNVQQGAATINGALDSIGKIGGGKAGEIFDGVKSKVAEATSGVFKLTQEIGFFSNGLGALQQLTANGPFQLLIGQNVALQEQLLATKASLVSTNKVIQDGRAIADPTAAIKALEAPVDQAITRLRTISLDLVGVTSKDLVPVYQLVAGYASQIGINLNQVADITASAAAAMGTLKIPLFQARQEIGSILTGTIDMNSVLAKSLGITNQQVATWKSQGRVYQELTTRLEAFRAGNKLASETINGYASNIREIFDIISQKAGAQLLDPITKQMSSIYKYLIDSQDSLVSLGEKVVGNLIEGVTGLANAMGIVFQSTASIGGNLLELLSEGAKKIMLGIANAIQTVMPFVQPLITVLGKVIETFGLLSSPITSFLITAKVASVALSTLTSGFGFFTQMIPGVSPLLAIMTGQGNNLVRTFSLMSSVIGPAGGAFAIFAQNLGSIPGGAGIASSAIAKLAPSFGSLAPIIAANSGKLAELLPGIAGTGIQVAALAKKYPVLGEAIKGIQPFLQKNAVELKGFAEKVAPLVDNLLPGMGTQLVGATGKLGEFTQGGQLAALAQVKLAEVTRDVKAEILATARSFAVTAGVLVLIAVAVNEFIIKNEKAMEVLSGVFKGLGALLGVIPQVAGAIYNFLVTPTGAFTAALVIMAATIYASAVPAILDFTKAQVGALGVEFAAKILPIGNAMLSMGLATEAGTAALGAFQAAMAEGTLSLTVFAAAAAAILTPLILAAGALFVAGLYAQTKVLQDASEAADTYAESTNFLSDRTASLTGQLKKSQDAQAEKTKAGIRLTDEEYKANKRLSDQASDQLKANLEKIAVLKAAQASAPEDLKGNYAGQIANLESAGKALETRLQSVQIAAKELPRVGTAYEQFATQTKTALEAIRNPSGEADKYKEQAKILLESTQAELKGNLITADDAIARFRLLATNAQTDKETQIKAREEITAARKIANDKDLADLTAAESKVKILQDSGKIGEAEAERQLSKVKKQELDKQLENLKQNKADADKVRADDINKQLGENGKKIIEAEKALAAAQGDPAAAKEVNNRQQSELKSGRAETVAQLKIVEDEIAKIQNDAKGKRGGEAAQADGKVADLRSKLIGLNQELGKTDDKLSALDTQAKTPPTPGNVNQDNVKAAQVALSAAQVERFEIEKKGETGSKDSARQFNNDKTKIDADRAKQEADDRKKAYDQKLLFQDEEQKILESKLATKQITEEKFNAESLKSTKTRLDSELVEVNRQKALLPKGDTDGLKKLEAQEADIGKRRFEADEKFYQKQQELRLKHSDSLQKIADSQLATGLISEEAYSDQSIKIANKRLDVELQEVARQRSKLAAGDKEGQLALMAQEAEIAKKRTEALEKFVQQRSALLERAEKKALDVAQLAATQRDTQLQELRNKNLIKDEEAGVAQVDSDKARLEAQLAAETEFANKLEKLPQLSNPEKENERQSQIRASRLKTAETTKQIVEDEGKQQEARVKLLQALIDRALKDKQNVLEEERQKTQKLLDLNQALADSLVAQNKVLESRKALEQSISDYAQGEFSLASSLTKSAYEKEQIERKQAEAKLVFLNRQQQFERLSLENDIQKNKALLEREQIQLRLDQLAAAGETADKKAELDKVMADPKATTRQKKAAQLGVDNASYKEDLLGYKGVVLNAEGQRQEADNANRREALGNKQGLESDGARADYAVKSKNIGLQNQLKEEFLQKGNNAVGNYYGAAEQTERTRNEVKTPDLGEYLKSKGRALPVEVTSVSSSQPTSGQARSPNGISQITGEPPAPSFTVPRLAPDQAGGIGQLAGAIAKFNQDVLAGFAKMAGINPSVTQNNEINNYNSGSPSAPNSVGAKTSQDVLNGLYDVFQAVKQRQAT